MKVIIAGSRDGCTAADVETAIHKSGFIISEVVSGVARGADRYGVAWAEGNKVPVTKFYPDWGKGRGAGLERNKQMADYAEALIAVWNGESRGTKHMIDTAKKKGLQVYVYITG